MRLHSMDFPDQQWELIRQEAKRQEISASYLIRRVMDIYLAPISAPRAASMSSAKLPAKTVRRAAKAAKEATAAPSS